jgi:hypothetical protein
MMKSRKDKINFLKGIQSGTRSVQELRPTRSIFLVKEDDSEMYREGITGKEWSESEIHEHKTNHPMDKVVIIRLTRG